ncbi:FAD-dependent oxidoreductase [Methylococcus capsulatus]|jgi:2-polyprenyl-6-methoxyphenol hydroxylase-like FAD-dependent oxidoreductase|uniref:3-(3-hydroxy-phenyl)propionate hydroxylase n=1 Tax=Methylococcus capsulatus TaxID=414 RepID=A0AA35V385_METCP|nr:FAD-dependent oxidoreductase [Methylococcus capsulatus]CAI8749883.1 3-(3-hydroxy-phenyl)propionate hydroxylase [Methylococcus capsulatus]
MNREILVVGAGPTGLSLAITLRRYGVPVRLVERKPEPAGVSKALAVWSASMEVLEGMGVMDALLAEGARLHSLRIGSGPRELAAMAIGDGIDSPYPFPLLLSQARTERILAAKLAELGVEIERGVELTQLSQDQEGVTAELKHPNGRVEIQRTPYLAGCDGARSTVRQALGIEFQGYTEPQTYLLGDVLIDGAGLDHNSIYLWWHNGGTVALFPFEEATWRVFAVRKPGAGDEATTIAELQEHIDRHGPGGLRLHDASWLSAFRINERLAERYRAGRCFLVGDAAHIHSPAGGQGMNTGIQDAVNLGWKLAYAANGIGNADLLLDSYEAERRPIARSVVKAAARKLHLAFGGGRLDTILRDVAVTVFGNMSAVQKMLQVELSETEIVYREGPLVALGLPQRKPRRTGVGARARDAALADPPRRLWSLLSEPHHSLLLFEDSRHPIPVDGIMEGTGDRLRIVRLDERSDPRGAARDRFHLDGSGWVLVRPDQVIAARGTGSRLDGLEPYFDQVLRSPR